MKTKAVLFLMFLGMAGMAFTQNKNVSQIPLIGSDAPAFTAETTNGPLQFPGDFGRSWKILFSHPQDFTPVCTSEILELARLQKRMDALGIRAAVISTDTKDRHLMWKKSMEEILSVENPLARIAFPLIDDSKATVSRLYGMLHQPVSTTKDVRGVFVINPGNKVEATFFYPNSIGRNMEEILRTVEALQTSYSTSLLTPVNWVPGGDLLVPHYPFTQEQVAANPALENDFYQVGGMLWFKKAGKE